MTQGVFLKPDRNCNYLAGDTYTFKVHRQLWPGPSVCVPCTSKYYIARNSQCHLEMKHVQSCTRNVGSYYLQSLTRLYKLKPSRLMGAAWQTRSRLGDSHELQSTFMIEGPSLEWTWSSVLGLVLWSLLESLYYMGSMSFKLTRAHVSR